MKLKTIRSRLINGKEYSRKELKKIRRNFKKKAKFSEETKRIFLDIKERESSLN